MDIFYASKFLWDLVNDLINFINLFLSTVILYSLTSWGLALWIIAFILGYLIFLRYNKRIEIKNIRSFEQSLKNEKMEVIGLTTDLAEILSSEIQQVIEAYWLSSADTTDIGVQSFGIAEIEINDFEIILRYQDTSHQTKKVKRTAYKDKDYSRALNASRYLSSAVWGDHNREDSVLFERLMVKVRESQENPSQTIKGPDIWDSLLGSYDIPIVIPQQDYFGFVPYAAVLAHYIMEARPPLTMGIHGDWGSGKTSLMNLVQRFLDEKSNVIIINFGAWKYTTQEALWRGLILKLLEKIESIAGPGAVKFWEERLYSAVTQEKKGSLALSIPGTIIASVKTASIFLVLLLFGRLNPAYYLVLAAANLISALKQEDTRWSIVGLDLKEILEQQKYTIMRQQMESLEEFKIAFEQIVWKMVLLKAKGDRYDAAHHRLVIFIDDLDRCLPDVALSVMESIKLFLDIPEAVFVLGFNKEMIGKGVQSKLKIGDKDESAEKITSRGIGEQYIEKILQISFEMPPGDIELVKRWIKHKYPQFATDEQITGLLLNCAGNNPRKIKRICSSLALSFEMITQVEKECRNIEVG